LSLLEPRDGTALVWDDTHVSYSDLLRKAHAYAGFVSTDGDRVAVFSENRLEWVYAAYGIWASGRTLVPIDAMSSAEEVAYILADCAPSIVFASQGTAAVLEHALTLAGAQPRVVPLDEVPQDQDSAKAVRVPSDQILAVIYTSGTTGSPKGVMLSAANLEANVSAVVAAGYFGEKCRALLLLPLHHVLPLAGALMAPLASGGRVVFATSLAGEALVATLQRNAVTVIIGVPRFYDMLHRALHQKIQVSLLARSFFASAARLRWRFFTRRVFGSVHRRFGGHLRYLVCGGAALSPETARTFDVLGFDICEGYGMTECAPMITFPRPGRIRLGTCGEPLTGCEVRTTDEGELIVRGPQVMVGYYQRPEETGAILREGWLHTGDLGSIDAEGFVTVTGRIKEILVLPSGKNVNPIPLEEALVKASSLVREVGIFQDGDSLGALVVLNRDEVPAGVDLEAWVRREVVEPVNATVAPYRRIHRILVVDDDLPRTRIGKLRRHLLPALAQASGMRETEPTLAGDSILGRIASFLEQQQGRPVSSSSRLEGDLSLDSLATVELAAFLESAFGVSASEASLHQFATVRDLGVHISSRATGKATGGRLSWSEILSPEVTPSLPHSSIYHRLLVYGSRLGVRLAFRVRARGGDRLPAGPCIIAPNHQSFLDGLFVIAFMRPRTVLSTFFYAKEKHVRTFLLRFLAQRSNTIVMKRGEGIRESLQKLAAALRRGEKVMIFPEGTRSVSGALGVFKESYAILSRELGIPVVPVVIDGAHRVLPAGSLIPRFLRRVSVTYLDPVTPGEGEGVETFNARVRAIIAERLAANRAAVEA
jgi:long-chain acyl-CoA synthetase